jgi:hypothetical protein
MIGPGGLPMGGMPGMGMMGMGVGMMGMGRMMMPSRDVVEKMIAYFGKVKRKSWPQFLRIFPSS